MCMCSLCPSFVSMSSLVFTLYSLLMLVMQVIRFFILLPIVEQTCLSHHSVESADFSWQYCPSLLVPLALIHEWLNKSKEKNKLEIKLDTNALLLEVGNRHQQGLFENWWKNVLCHDTSKMENVCVYWFPVDRINYEAVEDIDPQIPLFLPISIICEFIIKKIFSWQWSSSSTSNGTWPRVQTAQYSNMCCKTSCLSGGRPELNHVFIHASDERSCRSIFVCVRLS